MTVLAGAKVLTPAGILDPGWLEIAGERIVAVGAGEPVAASRDGFCRFEHQLLMPGLVQLHVHGGGGFSYPGGDVNEISRIIEFHRRGGMTRTLASLVTAPVEELEAALGPLAELTEDGMLSGVHLEGPFLSPEYRGAQDARFLIHPDRRVLDRLLRLGRGAVRMVTVAPELPGAIELIRELVDANVIAAIGHSNADYAQAAAAIDAGAKVATHLFNGMRPFHHRDPGIIGAALDREEVICELITDGVHLHPATVRLAFKSAASRVALVTDAMCAAGAPDGCYWLGPTRVRVDNGQAYVKENGSLAGSTITSAEGLAGAVLGAGVPLEAASAAASAVPAALLGLDAGTIEVGKLADLVVFDASFSVVAVAVAGRWLSLDADGIPTHNPPGS